MSVSILNKLGYLSGGLRVHGCRQITNIYNSYYHNIHNIIHKLLISWCFDNNIKEPYILCINVDPNEWFCNIIIEVWDKDKYSIQV